MKRYTLTLTALELAALERERQRMGARSLADVVRAWIAIAARPLHTVDLPGVGERRVGAPK